MTRLALILLPFVAAACLALALPDALRPWVLGLAIAGCTAVIAWASVGQRNRLLGPCVTRGDGDRDRIALTFDDGPAPACTPALLDLLARYDAKATFFLVGRHAEAAPDLARRIRDAGHQIGNHSYAHRPWLTFAPRGALRRDLERCQDVIEAATGARPTWFRPPYGIRTHATHPVTQDLGMRVAGWCAGGLDTLERRSVDDVVTRTCNRLQPGAIVLLHDSGPPPERTLQIAERVLQEAARRGLKPVTLDELLPAERATA